MSSAFNPVVIGYRTSIDPADFPAPWIINQRAADTLFNADVPIRYWKAVADVATEMTRPEKDAVDAAALASRRDGTTAGLDATESLERALTLSLLDEVNAQAAILKSILDAIDAATTLVDLKASVLAITDPPQRTIAQIKTTLRTKLGT